MTAKHPEPQREVAGVLAGGGLSETEAWAGEQRVAGDLSACLDGSGIFLLNLTKCQRLKGLSNTNPQSGQITCPH